MIKIAAKNHFGILLASFALTAYIIALLFFSYHSHTERNELALNQLTTNAEKRAEALSYFFSERKNDMENLAAAREISTFFANKALGMSMEYGLKASLIAMSNLFTHTIQQKKIKIDNIYAWITFVDSEGAVLASTLDDPLSAVPKINFNRFLNPATLTPTILNENLDREASILISTPFFYKDRYQGQLIAQINSPAALMPLIDTSSLSSHTVTQVCIATDKGCVYHGSINNSLFLKIPYNTLNRIGDTTKTIEIPKADGSHVEAVLIKTQVYGTPFFVITLVPTQEIFGSIAPAQLIAALGLLAMLILFGVLLGIRINTENLVLHARFEESEKQQQILESRNLQLQQEIAKRREGEQRLNHLAHHDPLTNLPNQLLLHDRLKQVLQRAYHNGHMAAVLFLDLDRFKNVNDTLGHPAGDELLRTTATRLMTVLRSEDMIARLGGDEFIVVLETLRQAQDAGLVAIKLMDALCHPFNIYDREVFITASIGVSLYPNHGKDPTELIMNADAAMYRAKALGRNNYQFYSAELTATALQRFSLENSLRRALERSELRLHYHPQFSFRTGTITGVEALLRWEHPELGLLLPDQFIPLAEETGFIEPVGDWVIDMACRQLKTWRSRGLPPLCMAVNLSSRQIMNPGLVNKVLKCLEETGVNPHDLEFEITESSLMSDPDRAIAVSRELHALGMGIAVDDFGTGYSSMNYLKRFSLTKLKIDRSFIQDLPHSPQDAAITKAIIALGHGIPVKVNGEGVESMEQLSFLQAWGCDEWQGYLFSMPVPADELEELIKGVNALTTAEHPGGNVIPLRRRPV